MKESDYINNYRLALAQFNLNQIKQENEMLKATAGATAPMPAYMFLPTSRVECKFSDCFEPVKEPEENDYKRGYMDGWMACADYFIKHEMNKEE